MPKAKQLIETAGAFLRALYGSLEENEGQILIWQLLHKSSTWFNDAEEAAKFAAGRTNIYVGAGLRPRALGAHKRGGSDDVIGIGGLWLDIDVDGPNRPTRDEALKLLTEIYPQKPTVINDTGGGFHPWWYLRELWLWEMTDKKERARAADLIARWQRLFISAAYNKGWKIDNTSDLARVMRIPGTTNSKYDEPRQVEIFQFNWARRYEPEDLIEFIEDIEKNTPGQQAIIVPFQSKNKKEYAPADAELLASRCPWLRHCRDDAAKLLEPEWYAMLGIIGRCVNGEVVAQKWSEPYPQYTQIETETKLVQALKSSGPVRCNTIALNFGDHWCNNCAYRGQVGSPVTVGIFPAPRDLPVIEIKAKPEPPFHKWDALTINDPRARESYNRERKKMNNVGCEISLATLTAGAGWTDQEICDLLVSHHITHGEKPRLADYYARTIALGKTNAEQTTAQSKIADIANLGMAEGMTGDEIKDKQAILKMISDLLRIQVTGFTRYLTEPPTYRMETEDGSVNLGSKCLSQENFRQAMFDSTKRMVRRMKAPRWDELLQALANASTDENVGPEATDAEAVKLWLEAYFAEMKTPDERGEVSLAARDGRPFIKDGRIVFSGPRFRQWLFISEFAVKLNGKEMGIILRRHGCKPEKARVEEKTFSVWEMPDTKKKKDEAIDE
jgi:hypothetical protein